MSDIQIPLLPTHYYHIYNHAIAKENFFDLEQDYIYFLSKVELYLLPVCDILTYSLLPNYFQFVVQIKPTPLIETFLISLLGSEKFIQKKSVNEYFISDRVSKQFSNLFNCYSKHYNFFRNRKGSLFIKNFRRAEIRNMNYLRTLICYVHQNPSTAGFVDGLDDWKFSSYHEIKSNQPTKIVRQNAIELFGNMKEFDAYHAFKFGLVKGFH